MTPHLTEARTPAGSHLPGDGQAAVLLGQLVPEVVVGRQLDGLLGSDQQDVD